MTTVYVAYQFANEAEAGDNEVDIIGVYSTKDAARVGILAAARIFVEDHPADEEYDEGYGKVTLRNCTNGFSEYKDVDDEDIETADCIVASEKSMSHCQWFKIKQMPLQ